MRSGLAVVLACLALLWVAPALAERRVALVVANSAYPSAPLSNPRVDLALIVPMLEDMDFEVIAVADADFDTFDAKIGEFLDAADDADLALFYFAGHGFAINEGINIQNYLLSVSADVTVTSDRALRRNGFALDELIALVTDRAKTSLFFLDACRNDPRVRSARGGTGRGLAALSPALNGDVFVGVSTRLGDVAADGPPGEGSPFARAFVTQMSAPGISVPSAFNKVRQTVEAETGIQRPEAIRSDLTEPDKVILVASLEPDRPDDDLLERARVDWMAIQDSESIAVLREFSAIYPLTPYARFALARVAELEAAALPVETIGSGQGTTADLLLEEIGGTGLGSKAEPVIADSSQHLASLGGSIGAPLVSQITPISYTSASPETVFALMPGTRLSALSGATDALGAEVDAGLWAKPISGGPVIQGIEVGEDGLPVSGREASLVSTITFPETDATPLQKQVPDDLPRAVQTELARLGCYRSKVDGIWGQFSRRALTRYFEATGKAGGLEPTAEYYLTLIGDTTTQCKVEATTTSTETKPTSTKSTSTKSTSTKSTSTKATQVATPSSTSGGSTRTTSTSSAAQSTSSSQTQTSSDSGIGKIDFGSGSFR